MQMSDFELRYGLNEHRRDLLDGLRSALSALYKAGCRRVYLDGSFITDKPIPEDYDGCWDHLGVDQHKLDPVLLDFDNGRANQKRKFLGELFPAISKANSSGPIFLEFFQIDKHTGTAKGIVLLELTSEI